MIDRSPGRATLIDTDRISVRRILAVQILLGLPHQGVSFADFVRAEFEERHYVALGNDLDMAFGCREVVVPDVKIVGLIQYRIDRLVADATEQAYRFVSWCTVLLDHRVPGHVVLSLWRVRLMPRWAACRARVIGCAGQPPSPVGITATPLLLDTYRRPGTGFWHYSSNVLWCRRLLAENQMLSVRGL